MASASQTSQPYVSISGLTLNKTREEEREHHSDALPPEIALEAFIQQLRMLMNSNLSKEEKERGLEKIDALELLQAVYDVNKELAAIKLENHVLVDFLEKNDPKLLVGLKRHQSVRSSTITSQGSVHSMKSTRRSSLRSVMTTATMYTNQSSRRLQDYRLNYKTKTDMAEKSAAEVEKRIKDSEAKAMHEIKLLNGRIEELRLRTRETEETVENFQLHFLRDQRDLLFLETATEKLIERKFRKFVNNWLKNARALLGTMRLRITALQESCQQHRNDLITKTDMSGIIGAVDFEQLKIKRDELIVSLEEKNVHLAGLKAVTGKASMAMSEEKQAMMAIEDESKRIQSRTIDVIKQIAKLEKEITLVETENDRDSKTLANLKEQLKHYEAPSVSQYIGKKDELLVLEKEEKMLHRKIYILNMKLNNLLKKFKRK